MRVMTWNIGNGGEERFASICARVREVAPGLLILQECVDWDDGVRLAAVADVVGVPATSRHTFIGVANQRSSGRRYHLALVSKAPITRARMHNTGFAHGVVKAEVVVDGQPLRIFGAHLVWSDEDARLIELAALQPLLPDDDGAVLLAGDLNSLSRAADDLAAQLARAGIEKYGHPPRFDVTDRLRAAGFVDALSSTNPPSWVTARRERQGQIVDTRSDYVLLSRGLARAVQAAHVVDAAGASDHHAVVVELRR